VVFPKSTIFPECKGSPHYPYLTIRVVRILAFNASVAHTFLIDPTCIILKSYRSVHLYSYTPHMTLLVCFVLEPLELRTLLVTILDSSHNFKVCFTTICSNNLPKTSIYLKTSFFSIQNITVISLAIILSNSFCTRARHFLALNCLQTLEKHFLWLLWNLALKTVPNGLILYVHGIYAI